MPTAQDANSHSPLLRNHDRCLAIVGRHVQDVRRFCDELARRLPETRVKAYAPDALAATLHDREHGVGLVIAIDTAGEVAEISSRHDLPVLWARDHRADAVADGLPEATVTAETLLCIHPEHRPVRFVLAECLVEPLGSGSLRVEGDHGLDAVVPMVRAVNRDPFGLLPESRCAHGASSMVGLCWSGAEPLADRMIHRRNRIVVTGVDTDGLHVTCDAGRFRLHTTRLTVGPARHLHVVHLP